MKGHKWNGLFILGLVGFTTYLALDTFVIPSTYRTQATEMNLSAFEAEAKEVTTDGNEEEKGDVQSSTDGSDENNVTETEAEKKEAFAEENAGPTGKKRGFGGKGGPGRKGRKSGSESSSEETKDAVKSTAPATTENAVSADSYQDENAAITLTEYTTNDTKVYVADVRLSSAQYLKTAFADDTYGKNVTDETSAIAADHNAVLAVNGDYYGARNTGFVIRNGVVYRDEASDADLLCIYADGSMKVTDQSSKTAQQLVEEGVWQAFSFGPALLEDSQIAVSEDEETGKAMASNPRTAIGIIDDLHYVFVVSDGRTDESAGLSLYELADFCKKLGAKTAYNLDGGGSSTMVFQGRVVNNPTTTGNSIKERKVSDIVYIG